MFFISNQVCKIQNDLENNQYHTSSFTYHIFFSEKYNKAATKR